MYWNNHFAKRGPKMKQMKLLLVDDEERFLATTRKLLSKSGYQAETASSGSEALEKIRNQPIHVVILDVKMPGMDGIETLREIKRQFPMVEVIMLTGHATVESAVEGLKSGATDYLMKPADMEDLIRKAEEAFARRRNLEEKIRVAQMRKLSGSPRSILQDS
jgi:DNA-binding NtrC family response regulator